MATTEKHAFQAEIGQLLEIVTHSLYTDKEIFVRELISNSADACEKLKFLQTSGTEILEPELSLKISVTTDDQAKTITIADTGVGMTRAELVENLGTIAHSGSRAFLEQLKANKDDANLIGQFGVGFYSAFMVAERVTVHTRSYRTEEEGLIWSSDGAGGYEIEPAEGLSRGTRIVLQLRDGEFATASTVQEIIKRYSNFVPFPIELNGEVVNTVQALWTKNKSEISESDYEGFYKYVAHDSEAPLFRLHFSADAPLSIRALLFVPAKNFELINMARGEIEVSLYCRKILIQPKAKALFPEWLRFLRGVVDSEDLPLNISRESMQDSALMRKLNEVLTKRVIRWLEDEAKADPEKYARFFLQHGPSLMEGVATDWGNREAISKLLRFPSSHTDPGKLTSLTDYVSRMPEGQTEIYYLLAQNREAAESNPYFEVFQEKKWEVLFLTDGRDEFVMEQLGFFDGKRVVAVEKAQVQLDKPQAEALSDEASGQLASFFKETLGDRVGEVRSSKRLTGSPAIAVDSDSHMTSSMRRIMKAIREREGAEPLPESQPDLEINPGHAIMQRLEQVRQSDAALAKQVAEQIYDNALLVAGMVEDPRSMMGRLNQFLERVLEK